VEGHRQPFRTDLDNTLHCHLQILQDDPSRDPQCAYAARFEEKLNDCIPPGPIMAVVGNSSDFNGGFRLRAEEIQHKGPRRVLPPELVIAWSVAGLLPMQRFRK
jgi:hypothetical protein